MSIRNSTNDPARRYAVRSSVTVLSGSGTSLYSAIPASSCSKAPLPSRTLAGGISVLAGLPKAVKYAAARRSARRGKPLEQEAIYRHLVRTINRIRKHGEPALHLVADRDRVEVDG